MNGRPMLPCDDPRLARRRMQYRNVRRRRLGLPIEVVPLLVRPRTVEPAPPVRPRGERALVELVDRSGGVDACWPWQGNRDENGYGRLTISHRSQRVHRRVLEQKLGRAIRPGYGALHTCDNPPCCNPAHLYEGTPADNVRDAIQRGRARRQMPAIDRWLWPVALELPPEEAAARLGVSIRTIYRTRERARAAA